MLILYNILLLFIILAGFPVIIPLLVLSPKRRKTILQRLGLISLPKTGKDKARIWIHALSVGEVISAIPLVRAVKSSFPDKDIFFSASTLTGFETAKREIKSDVAAIFFFPYDLIFSVKHAAGRISPDFVIIVETDIWPNFLMEMEKRDIPVFLVNTRLSKKSFTGYKYFSFFTRPVFQKFSRICAQSSADAQRFEALGVQKQNIIITGNVKFDQQEIPVSDEDVRQMRGSMNIAPGRKIIAAGSTHEGEEALILNAFSRLRLSISSLCLILAPRNPDRADHVCRLFKTAGFNAVTMSMMEKSRKEFDVMIVDRIGVLKKLYAVSDLAFIGGSLVNFGGHNPLEPAAFSKPLIYGPYMSDFKEIAGMLMDSGGAVQVSDSQSLYDAALTFLNFNDKAEAAGIQAFKIFKENKGAVNRTLNVIEKYFSLQ